jgi:hypothetical protein
VIERLALDQPHDEIKQLALVPKIVYGQNTRVLQVGDHARLALETRYELWVFGQVRAHDLDRHVALHVDLPRPVNRRHPALTHAAQDFVIANGLPKKWIVDHEKVFLTAPYPG